MAFSFPAPGSSGRRRHAPPLSEINIIPLVDVVLVLLIIFMLTAHVMEFGLEIQVPTVRQVSNTIEDLPVVNVTSGGDVQLNDKLVNINVLATEVRQRFPKATEVYVRADKSTVWDALAQVVAALGEAKLGVKMVTEPMEDNPRNNRRGGG